MILGIGTDITDIRRIEQTLTRFDTRFIERTFTKAEQAYATKRRNAGSKTLAGTYAKRFAAKEACAKALGLGFRQGVSWQDIEIINDKNSKPLLVLHGIAAEHLHSLLPKDMVSRLHLALSDEYPYAQAYVIIEAVNA